MGVSLALRRFVSWPLLAGYVLAIPDPRLYAEIKKAALPAPASALTRPSLPVVAAPAVLPPTVAVAVSESALAQAAALPASPLGSPSTAGLSAYDGARPAQGIELEYALGVTAPEDTRSIPAQAYFGILAGVADRFRLRAPKLGRDRKYGRGHWTVSAVDERDRSWKAVPEEVDGRRYDGVELVSPPLSSRAEVEELARVHGELLAGGQYKRGINSSAHFTVGVSHLIGPNGDASKLVDAILFIESHWKEIYAAVAPSRYASIVNRYSVPLAVDQPALLRELAALPREQRTIVRVQALFARYDEAERNLHHGDRVRAWKYRAANYGKLFGLQKGYTDSPLSVIEFRIADLPQEQRLPALSDLFAALVTRAPPQNSFQPPFEGGRDFPMLNAQIESQDQGAYAAFLERLGLERKEYPFPSRGELAARAAAAAGLEKGIDQARERRFLAASLQGLSDEVAVPLALVLMDDADLYTRLSVLERLEVLGLDFRRLAFKRIAEAPLRACPTERPMVLCPSPCSFGPSPWNASGPNALDGSSC